MQISQFGRRLAPPPWGMVGAEPGLVVGRSCGCGSGLARHTGRCHRVRAGWLGPRTGTGGPGLCSGGLAVGVGSGRLAGQAGLAGVEAAVAECPAAQAVAGVLGQVGGRDGEHRAVGVGQAVPGDRAAHQPGLTPRSPPPRARHPGRRSYKDLFNT
jgi:hypothetical protein